MSLAATMLFYAAQPGAYDIAVLIGDDSDYAPALRKLRLMGKRVQVVSARLDGRPGNPASSLTTKHRVSDFPTLWLD